MKHLFVLGLLSILTISLPAQKTGKIFWYEDFSTGQLPAGWSTKALNDSTVNWIITDQPYPGSWGHTQQAPPIASSSRGYHLQFAPGVIVDKNSRKWHTASQYPDAFIQTSAINCKSKKSVVLRFQQKFYWNRRYASEKSGLFVGVSNDGHSWVEYDVRQDIGPRQESPNPMEIELNITRIAARQKTVYLRFYWKGLYHWYWMIDDIRLSEAFESDIQAYDLISHPETGNSFTNHDMMTFRIINLSAKKLTRDFKCYLQIDQRQPLEVVVPASRRTPISIIDTVQVSFRPIDLTDYGIHQIRFYSALPGDLRTSNDTLTKTLYSGAYSLGDVTGFQPGDQEFTFSCHNARLKIRFLREDIYRVQMAYDGHFTNPAGNDLVIHTPDAPVLVKERDQGDYYLFQTRQLALRVYKHPLRLAQYRPDNKTLVWQETNGLTYGKETVQYIKRGKNEYFYGGGMQNGRFSHRGQTIKLTIDYNWEDGGNPNPAPFFMSNKGWGAFRNTYAPGYYSFKDTVRLVHKEARFDSYFFTGSSLKDILGDYTDLTGKPFLMPRWALSMGDANCYNRGAKSKTKTIGSTRSGFSGTTPDVIWLIADEYIKHKMPRGWILPNDGYGCGYTKLDSVVKELHKKGFMTGLWTESGVDKIAYEVGTLGSRLCKLDVAWVGNGYKFAIDGVKDAYEGIENNSEARGFVWSVCGWAGTQRHSVVWTGDQSGSWDYIRWHIPTVIGSGLSAQNCATGDVDGIFGGSDSTYVRDLQWKCFTPAFMTMSGWATNNKNGIKDKQPWLFGEPFTSINRKYLQLKQRLTPYMYTLCAEANFTGVPAVRALVLEYPDDPVALGTKTQYQFLLGKDLLVAPVYTPSDERDSIYFPAGTWIDYWDGTRYEGNTWLKKYNAPLDKLPLFVRSGAIIPMYQPMYYDWERPTDTLTLDIYPDEHSIYDLYEDDGLTREHRQGIYAFTRFEVSVADDDPNVAVITIYPAKGDFKGRLKERTYLIRLHNPEKGSIISATTGKVSTDIKTTIRVKTDL